MDDFLEVPLNLPSIREDSKNTKRKTSTSTIGTYFLMEKPLLQESIKLPRYSDCEMQTTIRTSLKRLPP
jgi:hypothetical protein